MRLSEAMTNNSLGRPSEELSREIRKLEARLEDFLEDENAFVKELRSCLEKLKELYDTIERLEMRPDHKEIEELIKLRLEVIKALSENLKRKAKLNTKKATYWNPTEP